MEAIFTVLFFVGCIIAFIGGIWLIVVAFQESLLWGLGCIFIPFVSLFFVIMHWKEAGKPFLVGLFGVILYSVAALMMADSGAPIDMGY